jgi:hypothetical protein
MSASPIRAQRYLFGALLTVAIVVLTLSTAYIHSTLGGMLFTLNAIGYALLAVAIVVGSAAPWPIVARFSWLPRVGLFGFALATIIGWMVMGPYYELAYIAKGIEVALLALLVIDSFRVYGGPAGLVTEAVASLQETLAAIRR